MKLKILHLSDLHFKQDTNTDELVSKIINVNSGHSPLISPCTIVVTGDIFDAAGFSSANYKKLIKKAVDFFNKLSSEFNIASISENLFIVPGNHELCQKSVENDNDKDKFKKYAEFLKSLYGANWESVSKDVYDTTHMCFVKLFEDKKTILIGFASPCYEKDVKKKNKFVSTARIGQQQLAAINKKITRIENYETCRVIACVHHNIYNSIERIKDKNFDNSCIQDNESMIDFLNYKNCSLILHGHRHITKTRRINLNQNIKQKDKMCTLIGSGSLNESSDGTIDSFSYIELAEPESNIDFNVKVFFDDGGRFVCDGFPIPVFEDGRYYTSIREIIDSDDNLKKSYSELESADTNFGDKQLAKVFDKTVCMFKEVSNKFIVSNDAVNPLAFVLGAAHYRVNYPNEVFLKYCKTFLESSLGKLFNSSECDDVFKLLELEIVNDMPKKYEELKKKYSNPKQKNALAYLALGLYLTEFFLSIKYNADEFYKAYISNKANYNLDEKSLKESFNGTTIEFKANEERRALEISVVCNTANAHKIMGLIIKEFEQLLTRFEEDFSALGFKIYYALPKIKEFNNAGEKTESYEFQAYMPQLIPLLAGKNIYSEHEAFARELIQNAIDAIKVRQQLEKQAGKDEKAKDSPKIKLELGLDKIKNLHYFKITDEGTGMSRYVLERYLTTIGRSFYTGSDFDDLNIQYNPISQFGIGFLSCFMLGKQVEVQTIHHDNLQESYYLDIPNFDGCFFIESKKAVGTSNAGSIITVWENAALRRDVKGPQFDINKIKNYIQKNIKNIPFDIMLDGKMFIPKYCHNLFLQEKTKEYDALFYVPISESGDTLKESELGIHFYIGDDDEGRQEQAATLLNNGILVKGLIYEFSEPLEKIHPFLSSSSNLSPSLLELEVSRDKFKKWKKNLKIENIKKELHSQIDAYVLSDKAKKLKYINYCGLDYLNKFIDDINIDFDSKNNVLKAKITNHGFNVESTRNEIEKYCKNIKASNKIDFEENFMSSRYIYNYANEFE